MQESNEVAAHQWRLAQQHRLTRYCDEQGVDPTAVMNGTVVLDLDPICDEVGKIRPERVDLDRARRGD